MSWLGICVLIWVCHPLKKTNNCQIQKRSLSRAYGSKTNAYKVFAGMLNYGNPPEVLATLQYKVQDADRIDRRQTVVAALRLFLGRKGGIVQAAVFEVVLLGLFSSTMKSSPPGLMQLRPKIALRSDWLAPCCSLRV